MTQIPKPIRLVQKSITNLDATNNKSDLKRPPRADFDPTRYSKLIQQHGVDVLVEHAVQCPCRGNSHNALSDCLNCGGTGWVFVNKRKTRMVVSNMAIKNIEEVWARLVQGLINLSYEDDEDLAYMDRVTRLNANAVFSEVITMYTKGNLTYGHTVYYPKSIDYIALFANTKDPLQLLTINDVTIEGNRIVLKDHVQLPDLDPLSNGDAITLAVRYKHAPTFHVIDVQREAFDHFKWKEATKKEELIYLPGKAVARRAHNIEDMTKQRQGYLNNNDSETNSLC